MSTGRLRTFSSSLPLGPLLWAGFGLFCTVGLTISLVDFSKLPAEETWRANTAHQRAIIDAATGMVSGLEAVKEDTFDVGNAEDTAPPDIGEEPKSQSPVTTEKPQLPQHLPRLRDTPQTDKAPSVPRSADSLVKAPAPEAIEQLGDLILPHKTGQGLSPSRLYSRGFNRKEGENLLAVLITDAGFSNDTLATLVALPKDVSVAVSPYATDSNAKIEALRNAGHEAWVMLPSATDDYPKEDPGPLGLLPTQPADAALGRVHKVMGSSIGAVGMVLPPDESITPNEKAWNVVFTEIDGRGLFTLSTRPDRSVDQIMPDKKRQETLKRADLVLDSTPATAFIRSKLSALSGQLSSTPRDVIVIASARPQTLSILEEWLKEQKDFTLAPLSAVYRGQEAPPPPPPEKKSHGGGH